MAWHAGTDGWPQAPDRHNAGQTRYSDYLPKPNPVRKAIHVPRSVKERDRSFASLSQRHDFVDSRVWLGSQDWLQGATRGIERARSQLGTCNVLSHQAEANPGQAWSSSRQQKGTGALEGSTAPVDPRQLAQILPGLLSTWVQAPGSVNASLVGHCGPRVTLPTGWTHLLTPRIPVIFHALP